MHATATELPVGTWCADTVHSTVEFRVGHNTISLYRGGFEKFEITLAVAETGVRLLAVAQADSIRSRSAQLAEHLKGPDFFDTAQHPEIRFESSRIERAGELAGVDGVLTIKGISRTVTGHCAISDVVEDPFGGTRVAFTAEFSISRAEYGISWTLDMPARGPYLADEVTISVTAELVKT
jgi:polyisoprenoid-binding protein YceI